MRGRRHLLLLPAAALVLAGSGCGPRYRTFTTYAPPADQVGRACLAECAAIRQSCRQDVGGMVQQCRLDAEAAAQRLHLQRLAEYGVELYHFEAGLTDHPPQKPGEARPDYRSCNYQAGNLEQQCQDDHDLCYQNCGGTITYTTQCVANCD
jgi:hypothetical protein